MWAVFSISFIINIPLPLRNETLLGFAINYSHYTPFIFSRITGLCVTFLLCANIALAQTAAESSWVANPESGDFCSGSYHTLSPSEDNKSAYIEADRSEFSFNEIAKLQGNVVLRNQGQEVKADSAQYDVQKQQLELEGNLSIQGSGIIVKGSKAILSSDATTGTIESASYVLQAQNARGGAERIQRTGATSISLEQGFYTSCPPGDSSWIVAARSIEINHDKGMGIAKNAVIKVKDVPVLVIPYLPFPIGETRRSGVLWPSFGSANEASGIDYAQPIYWNIAPQADATITPRIVGDRGFGIENEVRYLNKYSQWQLSGSYFSDTIEDEDRWLLAVKESGQISESWSHSIDISRISDDDYFEDFDVTSLDVQRQTHLLQAGQIDYQSNKLSSSLAVRQYQTIETDLLEPHRIRPQLSIYTNAQNQHAKAELIGVLEYSDFDTNNTSEAKGQRLYYETGVALPLNWQAGYLHSQASVKGLKYELDQQHLLFDSNSKPSVQVASASIDAGLIFEKIGSQGRQTLEPRVSYHFTEFEDQTDLPVFDTRQAALSVAQQFKASRFSGLDRIDNANQLSLGLYHRYFNQLGQETLSMGIAQTFYFDDKKVFLPSAQTITDSASPLLADIVFQPLKGLSASINIALANSFKRVERANWRLSYQNDRDLLLTASQVYKRNETNNTVTDQTELSAALPLSKNWRAYAQHHYDQRNSKSVQNTLGFAYESCCWKVRALYQQSLDNDDVVGTQNSGIFIEFELKGLGGAGAATDSILADTIYGFKQ